jgi:hypothetical protein
MRRAAALGLWALGLAAPVTSAAPRRPQVELGLELFANRSAATPLAPAGLLPLDKVEGVGRLSLGLEHKLGQRWHLAARGFVERGLSPTGNDTSWTLRQAYVRYDAGAALSLRAGWQRLAWGSGLAFNPTNRLERPKSAFNAALEQQGVPALRADWQPAAWFNVTLVGARTETVPADLPLRGAAPRADLAALRMSALVRDTDVALVLSGGARRRLIGLDLARTLGTSCALHLEGALYRGRELAPASSDGVEARVVVGLLHTGFTDTSLALEYFYNGEGDSQSALDAFLARLRQAQDDARDERLPASVRALAHATAVAGALRPYAGGLGLRRHYLHAAWTRSQLRMKWTASLRALIGLADGGLALTPGALYAPHDHVTVALDALLLLGPPSSEYRLAPVRGALQARLKVLF